jgi:hypothetical protein
MRGIMKVAGLVALGYLGLLGQASADAIVLQCDATNVGAFGAGPYCTITLTENAGNVDVSVSLRSDMNFVTTGNTNSHTVFSFNASGIALSDITNIVGGDSTGYTAVAPAGNSPFGTFLFGIICNANCENGGSGGGYDDPLTFTVLNAVLADFYNLSTDGTAAYFAADVICVGTTCNGATGAVGVTDKTPPDEVPEPGTLALLGLGLAGLGFGARRRRKI